MGLRDYRPTGRESQVLRAVKEASDQEISDDELYRQVGVAPDVLEQALENLELAGCITQTGDGTYGFVQDPVGY